MIRAVACFLAATVFFASLAVSADDRGHQMQLVQQKIKLLDSIIDRSDAIKNIMAGDSDEAKNIVGQARSYTDEARRIAESGDYQTATLVAEEALKLLTYISSFDRKTRPDTHAQDLRFRELQKLIASIAEIGQVPLSDDQQRRLEQAKSLGEEGNLKDATEQLAALYDELVEVSIRNFDNKTLVYRLEFTSPAEEYQYELELYSSGRKMLGMVLDKSRDTSKGAMLEKFLAEAEQLAQSAAGDAEKEQFSTAVDLIEQANTKLRLALRLLGMQG